MTTETWHEWRGKGLGSSDAPIIMGVSPWSTPYQLWEQKTKRVKRDFSNWATERGNRLEPVARASYEFENALEAPPTLVVNPEYPFIRASLDGYNSMLGIVLEIKCPGKVDHEKALNGQIPEKYFPQIQHQLLACPSAKVAHYYSFDGSKGVKIEVLRDSQYQEILLETEKVFWDCIQRDIPPGFTSRDFKRIKGKDLEELLINYEQLHNNVERLNRTLDTLKEQIFNHKDVGDSRVSVDDKWRISNRSIEVMK